MSMRPLHRRHALALLPGLLPIGVARAQGDYPSRPVRLLVGYPPGGSVDLLARNLAEGMAGLLGTALVVENVGGAAGAVGAQRVVNSAPDGYTLLVGSNNELVSTGVLNPAQRYDAQTDLVPIGLLLQGPVVWVAGPAARVRGLADCVQTVRRQPGRFSYGSSGVGSVPHFAGELLKQQAGLHIVHIPYNGVGPLINDLVGGRIEYAMLSLPAVITQIQAGRVHPLAVTTVQRVRALPEVPAMGEHPQLRSYELIGWFALMAPRGLPPALQAQLRGVLQQTLALPALREKLELFGSVAARGTEDVTELMARDRAQYLKLARFAGINP